eukprot:FR743489.1.p2 GENE.FR743489.1~~FR743489.1.p2  ORF type:complete len:162 (-),score=17.60 FR743489.1:95-580(-)
MSNREAEGEHKAQLIAEVLCNSNVYVGDQLESGSPSDISFWPIHPTIERLWMWKKLRKGFTDEKWVDGDPISIFGATCTGHAAEDMVAYPFSFWDEASRERLYSNRELYELANPEGSRLPYIYDSFEWPHCEQRGCNFRKAPVKRTTVHITNPNPTDAEVR